MDWQALRAGILAGSIEQTKSVRRVSSPYNVNALALLALPTALEDREYVARYVAQGKQGRKRLCDALERLGFPCWPSQANFVLFYVGERHQDFVSAIRQRGILVRDRSADPGCDGCVRITIGTTAQIDQALPAMEQVLAELGLAQAVSA